MLWLVAGSAHSARAAPADVDFKGRRVSAEARIVATWALNARNAQGKPFAIVDKKAARLYVFAADGELTGDAPALLGLTRGDEDAAPRAPRMVLDRQPHERTTPAGRFDSEPGHNLKGEAIVWVDYDAGLAIHRLRPTHPAERRPQRLASDSPDDNRISLGCIVVEPAFYDEVVAPMLGRRRGVVYVLPEIGDSTALLGLTASAAR